jgi:Ser/Thr protein kinase RdoA (MazF antagonist)
VATWESGAVQIEENRGGMLPPDQMRAHLETTYGIEVSGLSELDTGVFRVDRRDGPSWVARHFPAERALQRVQEDAEILAGLEALGFPAERRAVPDPVSVLDGQGVLVTEHVPSVPLSERREAFREAGGLRTVGELLARLCGCEAPPAAFERPGGAWHHLADGGPADEIAAATRMLDDVGRLIPPGERAAYDVLQHELQTLDDADGLPLAFVHADFVVPNIVAGRESGLVVVDWAGAGRAPRVWALAFLLWSVGHGGDLRRVDRVVAGYRRQHRLEPAEQARLSDIVRARPVIFDTWAFCTGRKALEDAARAARESRATARAIAARASAGFAR